MLPTELLSHRQNGESIVPLRLKIDAKNLEAATEMINCFQESIGKTQGELDKHLQSLEGDSPDYRVKRGFAHLLRGGFSTFEIISPLEPIALRQRVFSLAAQHLGCPVPHDRLVPGRRFCPTVNSIGTPTARRQMRKRRRQQQQQLRTRRTTRLIERSSVNSATMRRAPH